MAVLTETQPRAAPGPAVRRGPSRRAAGARRNLTAYALMAGGLVCFGLFAWYPTVRAFALAFQEADFGGGSQWVGLANFERLIADPEFAQAWVNTGLFTGMALLIGFAVPFVLAVLINELRHAKGMFRLLVYLPVMVPPAVTALLWNWFYDPGPGLFNSVLRALDLPTSAWTDSTSTSLLSLVLVATWANLGGATLIYLAALQSIPGELYESAELDGAGLFRRLWHVTLPQTRFVILVLLLLQIVATMQEFTYPFIMTGGGPGDSTITVLYLIYKYAFVYGDFGAACALTAMLFVVLGTFSAGYLWLTRGAD
ncbi:MAG: carbohydrate ABC transporter permease [Thermocrispum sp.]